MMLPLRILGIVTMMAVGLSLGMRPAPAAAQAAIPTVTITAREYAFDLPETVPGGLVALTIRNAGNAPHAAQLLRLNPGVTVQQVLDVNRRAETGDMQAEAEFFRLVTTSGGAENLEPEASLDLVLVLAEGDYMVIDFESADKGMAVPFRVDGAGTNAAEPRADVEGALRDFAFELPPVLAAGQTMLKLTNVGSQSHHMVLYKLDEGYGLSDVLAALDAPEPPSWVTPAGGLAAIAPGMTAWVTLNLTPGAYVGLCFLPDVETGKSHVELGMLTLFRAE